MTMIVVDLVRSLNAIYNNLVQRDSCKYLFRLMAN